MILFRGALYNRPSWFMLSNLRAYPCVPKSGFACCPHKIPTPRDCRVLVSQRLSVAT